MRATRIVKGGLLGAALVAVGIAGAATTARAEGGAFAGFRCGGRLVNGGETEDDVAGKCGDPDAVRSWTEVQTESIWEAGHKVERSVPIQYDEWKYDFGRDRLVRYVTFVQGRLATVRTGTYGR